VRCVIDLARVPCVAGATPADALASGEEYELACAAPADLDVEACRRATGVELTRVGRAEAPSTGRGPGVAVHATPDAPGALVDLPSGHDHLSR
jgi:thiamine monophosphate kinase